MEKFIAIPPTVTCFSLENIQKIWLNYYTLDNIDSIMTITGEKLLKIGFNSERSKYGLVIVKTTKRKSKH